MTLIETLSHNARAASQALANAPLSQRHAVLTALADYLIADTPAILAANARDIADHADRISPQMAKRVTLSAAAITTIAAGLRDLTQLPDPLAVTPDTWQTAAGLNLTKKTVPLGVLAMIYEARPNVTIDAVALAVKSGNTVILRGGKEALATNQALMASVEKALINAGLPTTAAQLITDPNRDNVAELLTARGLIDVLIPRGSENFINYVVANATVPVIETGAGNVHIFVDDDVDQAMAIDVIHNAKTQKPAVCNAAEKVLVHEAIAATFLPKLVTNLTAAGVTVRGDAAAVASDPRIVPATDDDWATEYNDLILAVHVVPSVTAAIDWINRYSTKHSEAILTNNAQHAADFMNTIDAAVVYHNASTRFTDGFEFGFGAEIGISTQKLHARGPMGLPALTTTKYFATGDGLIRN